MFKSIMNRPSMGSRLSGIKVSGSSPDAFFITNIFYYINSVRWSRPVARWAHNPEVGGSNPPRATHLVASLKPMP